MVIVCVIVSVCIMWAGRVAAVHRSGFFKLTFLESILLESYHKIWPFRLKRIQLSNQEACFSNYFVFTRIIGRTKPVMLMPRCCHKKLYCLFKASRTAGWFKCWNAVFGYHRFRYMDRTQHIHLLKITPCSDNFWSGIPAIMSKRGKVIG